MFMNRRVMSQPFSSHEMWISPCAPLPTVFLSTLPMISSPSCTNTYMHTPRQTFRHANISGGGGGGRHHVPLFRVEEGERARPRARLRARWSWQTANESQPYLYPCASRYRSTCTTVQATAAAAAKAGAAAATHVPSVADTASNQHGGSKYPPLQSSPSSKASKTNDCPPQERVPREHACPPWCRSC